MSTYHTFMGAGVVLYKMGTKGSFPGGKVAGVWSQILTSIEHQVKHVDLHLHSPIHLHYVVF